jgi:hypothetical protein
MEGALFPKYVTQKRKKYKTFSLYGSRETDTWVWSAVLGPYSEG